jgi:hypothetical protein
LGGAGGSCRTETEIPADTENPPHNAEHEYFQWGQFVGRSVGMIASWASIPNAAYAQMERGEA